MHRRTVLRSLGAAGIATLPTVSAAGTEVQGGHTLDLSIWQTERMATMASVKRDDPAYAQVVAKNYAEAYYSKFVENSDVFDELNVQIRSPPIAPDTAGEYDNPSTNIVARLLDFNGQLHAKYKPAVHSNLLIDTPVGGRAIGVGFMAPDDTIGGELTDAAMVDYGKYLLQLDKNQIEEQVTLINNNTITDRGWGAFVAQAALQEVGHNLKLHHNEGMGKLVGETPAATPMTSAYMIGFGAQGKLNACGRPYPEVEFVQEGLGEITFKDDFMLLTSEASECAMMHFEADAREWAQKRAESSSLAVQGVRAATGEAKVSEIPKPLYAKFTAEN